ncbi:hypothetical protein [Tessaracoccus caeni]|uniref:hypothetical protein n=1 Tax=Tessaracoccus caeni TaxID=3031239 RepID=UPI0023DB3408|nr:hypothetical protein [Tessaracoccus caeni]MDF1489256.1 hypothetical protein [Tessaracoccus caeni]
MSAKFLVTYPCQNECGAVKTGKVVDGDPVYECPGCGSEWIEITQLPQPKRTPEEENPFLKPR